MIRSIRHHVMTTCGIAGPFLLLAIGFGTGFVIAAALGTTPL
ncbi:hypothetical protein [Streptomyces diacarni]|nr:hypothetical protein [Streptomyces diacarni]